MVLASAYYVELGLLPPEIGNLAMPHNMTDAGGDHEAIKRRGGR